MKKLAIFSLMALMVVPASAGAERFVREQTVDEFKKENPDCLEVVYKGGGLMCLKFETKDEIKVSEDTEILGAITETKTEKKQDEAVEKLRQELIAMIMDLLRQIEELKKQGIIK